jgi:hypothetical protein
MLKSAYEPIVQAFSGLMMMPPAVGQHNDEVLGSRAPENRATREGGAR